MKSTLVETIYQLYHAAKAHPLAALVSLFLFIFGIISDAVVQRQINAQVKEETCEIAYANLCHINFKGFKWERIRTHTPS